MRKFVLAAVAALAVTFAGPVEATGSKGNNNYNKSTAVAVAGAQAKQRQSIDAEFRNVNRNKNTNKQSQGQGQSQSVNNSDSVVVEGDDIPRFTGNVTVFLGSLANDKCGRVALGVPYSAHTCNVLLEGENIYQALLPLYGEAFAAQARVRHLAENDRTMRNTLRRAGVIK